MLTCINNNISLTRGDSAIFALSIKKADGEPYMIGEGDMYNVTTADKANGIKAGDNVVYNGNSWDNMGGTIDLSSYATKEELNQKMNETPFAEASDITALFN